MPMPKKANGANFTVSGGGALAVEFEAGGPAIVYVVCIWGPKPMFGGQRPKVWCSEQLTGKDGARVDVPEGMAVAGSQITWSGGLIAAGESQGRLLVTLAQEGGESVSFSYDYNFTEKNQTESFYDGLNFT